MKDKKTRYFVVGSVCVGIVAMFALGHQYLNYKSSVFQTHENKKAQKREMAWVKTHKFFGTELNVIQTWLLEENITNNEPNAKMMKYDINKETHIDSPIHYIKNWQDSSSSWLAVSMPTQMKLTKSDMRKHRKLLTDDIFKLFNIPKTAHNRQLINQFANKNFYEFSISPALVKNQKTINAPH